MRLKIALLTLTLAVAPAARPRSSAQFGETTAPSSSPAFPAELMQRLASIRDAALADDYTYQQLAHLTENIGPRMSGSPEAKKAVEYVEQELRKLGLEVRLEEARVPHWVRGIETGELVEYPGQAPETAQKIVLTALGGSTATPTEGITAEVVVANNFDQLKMLGREKTAGKIVVFNFPFDKERAAAGYALDAYGEAVTYRSNGAKSAAELGAVASLIRSVGGADYRLPHTGWSVPAGIPAGAVTAEDADLIAHLCEQGRVRMHLTLTPRRLPEVTSYNVVADIKGSEHPEQIIVVSGHLDSWDLGTGAIDDAAGVAVAMEVAHVVQQQHLRPRRTIRVIAWMDEENGGGGRDAYAKAHASEFANHVAVMESDLGAAHPLGFDAKISPAALEILKPVQTILQAFGANLIKPTNYSPGADISTMAKAGIPAFGLKQDGRTYFNYHHSAADTLDKIAPRELRENAAAFAVLSYGLADMAPTLPR